MANFKQYSRYTNGVVLTNRANEQFLQLRQTLVLAQDPSDTYVTITSQFENRVDLLSSYIYGVPDLWWVICDYNNIQDPFSQLTAGTVIIVPTLDRILPFITA